MKFVTRNEILDVNKTTETIIGAAIEVHRHLGPGLLQVISKIPCHSERALLRDRHSLALPARASVRRTPVQVRVLNFRCQRSFAPLRMTFLRQVLESAYEECLCEESLLRKVPFKRQLALPVTYKSKKLDIGYRIDLLVNNEVVVELKTIESILPVHEAQTLTYMRLGGWQVGLILNFNVTVLKNGIKRLVYKLKE